MTCTEHQRDRAQGPGYRGDWGRYVQEAEEHTLAASPARLGRLLIETIHAHQSLNSLQIPGGLQRDHASVVAALPRCRTKRL